MKDDRLPEALIWIDDGHLSEIALTALADGQTGILPADAMAHLEGCDACARRLGEAALLSADTGAAVALVAAEQRAAARRAARIPLVAIAAALAVAVLGMLPFASDARTLWADVTFVVAHGVPTLVRGAPVAWRAFQQHGALLGCLSAVVLVAAGLALARATARSSLHEGVSR
jgi:hypothetical protein